MSKTFYIIDGHAQIFRAYFAPFRELTSPTGEPTKATFVFTQMLINLILQRRPDYLAMVIDSGDEQVFRREIFPEYKANRTAKPDDFAPQEARILQIVRDAGVPIFEKPGFEADDLIATMTDKLCQSGFDIVLVSKDKDLRQLLSECVRMYDVQSDTFMDVAAMIEKCGYGPDKAVEVQTLMGDTVDNIPGIPGVGEKTAAKLINKYGSVDEVLKHVDELTPKMRENFQKYADQLPLSRQLVTLRRDVEFDFDPELCAFHGLNVDKVRRHLESLGFTSLLGRLEQIAPRPADAPSTAPGPMTTGAAGTQGSLFGDIEALPDRPPAESCDDCTYTCVTPATFDQFVAELKRQKRFAFDTETDALGAMNSSLVGISVSWQHKTGYYIPVMGPADAEVVPLERVVAALKPIFEDPSIRKVAHNAKYDILMLKQVGIEVRGLEMDSMIAAFILDAGRMQYGIDRLALDILNFRKIPTEALIGKGRKQISMSRVELDRIACYAAEDADIALRLADHFDKQFEAFPRLRKLMDELETPLIDVLVEMEHNGIALDERILKEQSEVLGQRVDELRERIQAEAGVEFNPDSPRQLADVLFEKLNLRVVKKIKTGRSTDVEVLEKLADEHPVPKLVLEYRQLVKLKNTYLDNLAQYKNPRTGRVHTHFNPTGAATGRLSSSDPNLQNIPIRTDEGRRIRLAFVPGDPVNNVLLTADYSQIELRVLAHFTQEPALVKAFSEDEDIHRAVAAEVFNVPLDQVTREQRAQAKIINFGIIYGVSAYGLARRIEGMSVPAAQELIDAYNRRFPSIQQFLQQCVMAAQSQGYVETILGRRRPVKEIHSGVLAQRNAAERIAINSVVQGSAADLIKLAMLNIHRKLKAENHPSRMLLQVHDELVFETPESVVESEADFVRREMVQAGKELGLTLPLKVEVGWGKNWQEVK